MKTFYIFAVLLVVALNSVKAQTVIDVDKDGVHKACQQEVPVKEEELEKFFEDAANVNDAIKCHLKCVMEKRGIMKDGKLDVQGFLKSLEPYPVFQNRQADIIKAGNDCKNAIGVDNCDTAFKAFKCLVEHETDIYGHL